MALPIKSRKGYKNVNTQYACIIVSTCILLSWLMYAPSHTHQPLRLGAILRKLNEMLKT